MTVCSSFGATRMEQYSHQTLKSTFAITDFAIEAISWLVVAATIFAVEGRQRLCNPPCACSPQRCMSTRVSPCDEFVGPGCHRCDQQQTESARGTSDNARRGTTGLW